MSSKRAKRQKQFRYGCEYKVGHDSKYDAAKTITRVWRHQGKMRPYKCKFCGKWHIGHF